MVSTLDQLLAQSPGATLPAVFWLGILSSLNVCAAVRLPVVVTYVAGVSNSKRHALALSALFTCGLIVGTVLLGLTATRAVDGTQSILQVNKYLFWVLGCCLVVVGVLVSGLINPQLVPEKWRNVCERLLRTGGVGALLLGIALGMLQTPACPTCRSQLLTVVGVVANQGLWLYGLILFIGFAVGQSLVALAVGALTSLVKPDLLARLRTRMCSIEQHMRLLAGNMLIVLGINFVIVG
ncbi:MAG: hypothetical protein A2Y76_07070 [Planctomycetes bacterium RBG_13_60_9]|nr:MAG: hypothetical protein A2Y76_07070 [Planctomycetes bacterium RBG_13_60_9]